MNYEEKRKYLERSRASIETGIKESERELWINIVLLAIFIIFFSCIKWLYWLALLLVLFTQSYIYHHSKLLVLYYATLPRTKYNGIMKFGSIDEDKDLGFTFLRAISTAIISFVFSYYCIMQYKGIVKWLLVFMYVRTALESAGFIFYCKRYFDFRTKEISNDDLSKEIPNDKGDEK